MKITSRSIISIESIGAVLRTTLPLTSAVLVCLATSIAWTQPAAKMSVELGQRLFRDPRFAELYARQAASNINAPPSYGDPVLDQLEGIDQFYPSPFRGQTMSCASCHFGDQASDAGSELRRQVRAFTDFARRSPVPQRDDGATHTSRNSPTILGTIRPDVDAYLHFDGEFATPEELSIGGLTGRNFGWLPNEREKAGRHIARVIREDNGASWAGGRGIPYSAQFSEFDVKRASDAEILHAVSVHMAEYMRSLDFARDKQGLYNGSPYDVFLKKNGLPRAPQPSESDMTYMQRLAKLAAALVNPKWVTSADRKFRDHEQEFEFGPLELQGLVTFTGRANCVQCHAAPDFTDHLAHNIGVSQEEYETFHRAGTFEKVAIPSLDRRTSQDIKQLTQAPLPGQRELADLGAWGILFNPLMQGAQAKLSRILCRSLELDCATISKQELLDRSVAVFKTPTLRDLGHSEPYMHSGHLDTIEHAVMLYIRSSFLARSDMMRNADPKLALVQVTGHDVRSLSAFLRSLNEDISDR